jgi:hypothetical protein
VPVPQLFILSIECMIDVNSCILDAILCTRHFLAKVCPFAGFPPMALDSSAAGSNQVVSVLGDRVGICFPNTVACGTQFIVLEMISSFSH